LGEVSRAPLQTAGSGQPAAPRQANRSHLFLRHLNRSPFDDLVFDRVAGLEVLFDDISDFGRPAPRDSTAASRAETPLGWGQAGLLRRLRRKIASRLIVSRRNLSDCSSLPRCLTRIGLPSQRPASHEAGHSALAKASISRANYLHIHPNPPLSYGDKSVCSQLASHDAATLVAVDLARRLASALRQLRKEAELTQTQMARRLGVSQPTLNRLEAANQNTTLKTLDRLIRALGCEVGDLFEGKLKPPRRR
jgi:DNA-binding XRE family transcriptional regulator